MSSLPINSLRSRSNLPSWLNEKLIDKADMEMAPMASTIEYGTGDQLDRQLANLNIVCPDESRKDLEGRLVDQDKQDRWVLVGFACFVATSILSSVFAMVTYTMGYFEIAFVVPLFTGPVIIHQREGLIKCKKKREWIGHLRNESKRIEDINYQLVAQIDLLRKEAIVLLLAIENDLRLIVENQGQDLEVTRALLKENRKITEAKKQLAEAVAFEALISTVLGSDKNDDHFIGDAELNLLAHRLELIEGVPFTGQELIYRFNRWSTKNLRNLVDTVRSLYVEKRCAQLSAEANNHFEVSPRTLGAHLLWKRKLEYDDVSL